MKLCCDTYVRHVKLVLKIMSNKKKEIKKETMLHKVSETNYYLRISRYTKKGIIAKAKVFFDW